MYIFITYIIEWARWVLVYTRLQYLYYLRVTCPKLYDRNFKHVGPGNMKCVCIYAADSREIDINFLYFTLLTYIH